MKIEKSYLKKEILYRCSYSGIKETDIMYDKLLRKRIAKMSFKYSNKRNEENFIKYKTYRLIVLSKG